ncbi:hypothetical protein SBA2_380002 [Acidobacteriia bacterium SbA2]|nr:hypothetical protein SBA2_380002 [Acidobacteriia bacterium SbA2]
MTFSQVRAQHARLRLKQFRNSETVVHLARWSKSRNNRHYHAVLCHELPHPTLDIGANIRDLLKANGRTVAKV